MAQTIKGSKRSIVIDESADDSSFTVRFDKSNTGAPFAFVFTNAAGEEVIFPVSVEVWHKLIAWLTEREKTR